jgi:hypothetical protein
MGSDDPSAALITGSCANPSDGTFFVEQLAESLRQQKVLRESWTRVLERSEKVRENVPIYIYVP